MRCYRCESEDLVLAALTSYEQVEYQKAGIVMRVCQNCGLEQNHAGDDENLSPEYAALVAPRKIQETEQ